MNTGHDGVERGLRQHEQQHRPGDPAEQRCRPEAEHARPLPGQLAPVADGAGHGARDEADRVRHVGRDGRVAEGEQDRKGDQRAAADQGVDRAGRHAGRGDGGDLGSAHGAAILARRSSVSAWTSPAPQRVRVQWPVSRVDLWDTGRSRPGCRTRRLPFGLESLPVRHPG